MIRKPKPKAIPIEIRTVHRVSIGETEELRPAIWMLGRSGAWYEVVPSKEYKPTYDEMAEAVFFWYRIVDFYSKPEDRIKVPGKRDEISRLFLQVCPCPPLRRISQLTSCSMRLRLEMALPLRMWLNVARSMLCFSSINSRQRRTSWHRRTSRAGLEPPGTRPRSTSGSKGDET